jgi:hypothetical protein
MAYQIDNQVLYYNLLDLLVLLVETFVVVTMAMGSASMICLFSIFSRSDSESGFDSVSLTLATNDFF